MNTGELDVKGSNIQRQWLQYSAQISLRARRPQWRDRTHISENPEKVTLHRHVGALWNTG